ncbi:uncharacterized protein EI97DRAFT_434276 [Westerdykella ornata]|uniref:Homeobox domain-containing protein n=1 Tax=Westerdykella ornata TaxID=318751 RepID=A0A6A6JGP3_WESOR|nr:uncharacterized protein EI97DRAFT_434276 [Westerdykella ornata]KAF2275435.1 hypothetical protein EI97DRAFT_434276 [Westerdykella ornata]
MSTNSLQGRLESCEDLVAPEHQGSHPAFVPGSRPCNDYPAQGTSNAANGCLSCGSWNATDSADRNGRCEGCHVSTTVQPSKLLLDDFDAKPIQSWMSTAVYHGRREPEPEERLVPTRCSACELSALIHPSTHFPCPSCAPPPSQQPPLQPQEEEDHKIRRSHARRTHKLPLSALTGLQAWLDAHQDDPYPSANEKKQLAQQCGITEKQVTTWFTNARARQLSPLDTYLSSASEQEAASETDIASAAALSPAYLSPSDNTGFTYLSDTATTRTPTGHGHCKAAASISGSSAFSVSASPLHARFLPSKSRRGKKKNYRRNLTSPHTYTTTSSNTASPQPNAYLQSPIEPLSDTTPSSAPDQELWQCTFCRRPLVPKSWRRHEETQHRPRAQWTCMLHGPRLTLTTTPSASGAAVSPIATTGTRTTTAAAAAAEETSFCAFCMLENPPEEHFRTHHRIPECERRSLAERTFFRPDHLRQHVRNFHGTGLGEVVQGRWKWGGNGGLGSGGSGNGEEVWICGFCGVKLRSWTVRERHVAGHFKEGRRMGEWREWPSPLPSPAAVDVDVGDEGIKRRETGRERRGSKWNPLKRFGTKKGEGEEADNELEEEAQEDHRSSFGSGFVRRLSRTLTRRSTTRRRSKEQQSGELAPTAAASNEHIKREEGVRDPAFAMMDFDAPALSNTAVSHMHTALAPMSMSMTMSNMPGFDYPMYQDRNNTLALPDINNDPLLPISNSNPNHPDISFMDVDIDWSHMGDGFAQSQLQMQQCPQFTSDPAAHGAGMGHPPSQMGLDGDLIGDGLAAGDGTWDLDTGVEYPVPTSGSHIPGGEMQSGGYRWGGLR